MSRSYSTHDGADSVEAESLLPTGFEKVRYHVRVEFYFWACLARHLAM